MYLYSKWRIRVKYGDGKNDRSNMVFTRRKCSGFDISTQDSRELFPIHPSLESHTPVRCCVFGGDERAKLPLELGREKQLVEGREPSRGWGYIGRGLGRPRTALL